MIVPTSSSLGVPQVQTNAGTSTITLPNRAPNRIEPKPKVDPTGGHKESFDDSFGVVWANDLAKTELTKQSPNFPVGSIIVREKFPTEQLGIPEVVIAMVKLEKGSSKSSGDWEFFVFKGSDLSLINREKKGSCAECHSNAKESDWVFKTYLKN